LIISTPLTFRPGSCNDCPPRKKDVVGLGGPKKQRRIATATSSFCSAVFFCPQHGIALSWVVVCGGPRARRFSFAPVRQPAHHRPFCVYRGDKPNRKGKSTMENNHNLQRYTINVDEFAPEFKKGDMIFVDTTARAKEGDFVLACTDGRMVIEKMVDGLSIIGRILWNARSCV
jgi:hypothetical protein